MDIYFVSHLLGRLVASYAILFVLLWIVAKFDTRLAFTRSYRWYGIIGTGVVFILGIAGSVT